MLIANIFQRQNRPDDAMAAYVEMRNRFKGDKRTAEATYHLAELTLQSKRKDKNEAAIKVLGDLVNEYPDSSWAPRALSTKAGVEEREKIKQTDSVLGMPVPAALVTNRFLVERYPTSDGAEAALVKLADLYDNLKRYDLEAKSLEDLGARFPSTRYDVWWNLGELYEKKVKDRDKARDAYRRVPSTSPRYKDAQKRIAK